MSGGEAWVETGQGHLWAEEGSGGYPNLGLGREAEPRGRDPNHLVPSCSEVK